MHFRYFTLKLARLHTNKGVASKAAVASSQDFGHLQTWEVRPEIQAHLILQTTLIHYRELWRKKVHFHYNLLTFPLTPGALLPLHVAASNNIQRNHLSAEQQSDLAKSPPVIKCKSDPTEEQGKQPNTDTRRGRTDNNYSAIWRCVSFKGALYCPFCASQQQQCRKGTFFTPDPGVFHPNQNTRELPG